jgi:hypothetical protein
VRKLTLEITSVYYGFAKLESLLLSDSATWSHFVSIIKDYYANCTSLI